MTTLRVKFPGTWPGWHIPEYTLTAVQHPLPTSDSARKAITVSVDSEPHSDYSSDSPVFRASLLTGSPKRPTVALKFALREDLIPDLEEEAAIYTGALEPLQGITVPHCYGLYVGEGEGGEPVACLVLEYWGECIRQPFEQLPLEVRYVVLSGSVAAVLSERTPLEESESSSDSEKSTSADSYMGTSRSGTCWNWTETSELLILIKPSNINATVT